MTADQIQERDLRYSGTVVRAAAELIRATGRAWDMTELENALGLMGYQQGTVKMGMMTHLESRDYHGGVFKLNKEWEFELLSGIKPSTLERRLRRADLKEYRPSLPGPVF